MQGNKNTYIGLIDTLSEKEDLFLEKFTGTRDSNFIKCLLVTSDIEDFLAKLKDWQPIKYLFVDIDLSDKKAIDLLRKLKEKIPNTEIILYTKHEDKNKFMTAINNGMIGYILKNSTCKELQDYIQILNEGGTVLPSKTLKELVLYIAKSHMEHNVNLKPRELQVLKYLAEGWTYKKIGEKLKITENGVGHYIRRIYKILNVHSKGEAINIYYNTIKKR
jgi:DNA-binding NarL/FixJ family response regulator